MPYEVLERHGGRFSILPPHERSEDSVGVLILLWHGLAPQRTKQGDDKARLQATALLYALAWRVGI